MKIIIMLAIIVVAFMVITTISYERHERKMFNSGICPRCGFPLMCFDTDSHGSRGYTCKRCYYVTWIFYKSVDKKALNAQNNLLDLPKMYNVLRPHIGHNVVCVCYGKDNEDPVDICIECEDCNTVLVSSEAHDIEV